MFSCTEVYESTWRGIQGSRPTDVIEKHVPAAETEEVPVDPERQLHEYTAGLQRFRGVYKQVLDPELLHDLDSLTAKEGHLEFPSDYWAKSVYSFAAAFRKDRNYEKRSNLLEALRILWTGRLTSFILGTAGLDAEEAENEIEKEAECFEKTKSHLLEVY